MRSLILYGCVFVACLSPLAAPATRMASASETLQPGESQTVAVADSRIGSAPCGFAVEREIAGEVELSPSIDESGNLVLTVAPVNLSGSLTNPANGNSVDIRWIRQNGETRIEADTAGTDVEIALTGFFYRLDDRARTDLDLSLPVDGADPVSFEPGLHSPNPWAHVCAMLA